VTRLTRSLSAIAVVTALVGVSVVGVRASYGALRHGYRVSGVFDRASYGVEPGIQVEHRGIAVGKVDDVRLVNDHAELVMTIYGHFKVPQSVVAAVRPRSIFGDPFVDLDFPDGSPGPYLSKGSVLDRTQVDADTSDLIASAVPLLRDINPQDLATILDELNKATAGQGHEIAAAIDNGTKLATLFASTIDAQLQALDSFSRFQAAIATTGPLFNSIAANSNIALPTLNSAEADFQRALTVVSQFADTLSNFLLQERPDIERMLTGGDNVVRLLIAREPQLEQVISGLANYVTKFAQGRSPEVLPNGSRFAYFKNFILFADVNSMICSILSQAGPVGAPILQAIGGSGGPLNCPPSTQGAKAGTAAREDLLNGADQVLAAPEVPQRVSVQALVDHILGRS
jgi:virulence factor Mce-like protein